MAIGAFIVGRIAQRVLFLEIPDYKEQLPVVYIGIAIVVSLVMSTYTRFEGKLRRDRTNAITLAALIVITLGFRYFLDTEVHSVLWAFYIWVEVLGAFLIVQFWTLTNEIFNSRQAKRVFAFIGGGGVLANIVFGLIIRQSVKDLGTENLLFMLVGCLAVAFVAVLALGRNAAPELTAARERRRGVAKTKKQLAPARRVFATRHVQFIAGVIVLTYLVSYLVDYQLNVVVGIEYAHVADPSGERSQFFASFFLFTGIIAGFIQFGLTARILERFGVLFALLLLPITMLAGSIGMLTAFAGLATASLTKGSEVALRYTVNDTTLQLLYLPLPTQVRGRAKAVIDGILKPVSIGAAGLFLVILVGNPFLDTLTGTDFGFGLGVYDLSWLVAAALIGWIVSLLFLRREYFKSLLETLQRRRLNVAEAKFQINDPATLKVLEDTLSSGQIGHILHALELLPNVPRKLRDPLDARAMTLLDHEADEVRVAALTYLGESGTKLDSAAIVGLLNDPSADVRASSTLALCALRHEGALGHVHHMLEDPADVVRAHAIAGLIKHGGLDGVLACADLLKKMLSSERPHDREQAAWILGKVGVQNFYQPLIPLLDDENERVRQAAIVAAGQLKSAELVAPLVAHLDAPRLAPYAIAALAAYGEPAIDIASEILADETRPSRLRAQAPRILARLQHPRGVDILGRLLLDKDVHVRSAVIQAVVALTHKVPEAPLDLNAVNQALRVEGRAYFTWLAIVADLDLGERAPLLKDALEHRMELAREHVLALLALKYPPDTIDLVSRNLASSQATTRANAVEVLDNMLGNDEKSYLIPLFEDKRADRKRADGEEVFGLPRKDRVARLTELLDSDDDWLQCCAAVAVGEWELKSLEEKIRALLASRDSVARETAIHVLVDLVGVEAIREKLEKMSDDPAPLVRRYAEHLLDA
jgi:HEAT repeat protein/MFS family permease